MVLSRLLSQNQPGGQGACRIWIAVNSARSASHVAVKNDSGGSVAQADTKPGFFKKISMRFNGIPLKGEDQAPAPSLFREVGKVFTPPEPFQSVPKDYKEFPERDLANFPYPEKPLYPPKTRMLLIPDSMLSPLQKITGASGPYVFLGAVTGFLINKEWLLLYDENMTKGIALLVAYFVLSRTFGYRMAQYEYKMVKEKVAELSKIVDAELKDAVEFRKTSEAETESLKAMQEKFPTIFKENLALQLEATYRRNVDAVANELKRRIDYLQEVEETKTRFERDIMLKSIIEGVQNQISKNEGNIKDAYLDNCINKLKTLSA